MSTAVARWIRRHDPELDAVHKAIRLALAVPISLAIGTLLIGNSSLSTFAVFGSVAILLFADFPGARSARLGANLVLFAVGAALITLGTLASRADAVAVLGMGIAGFLVLFSGVLSSVTAAGTRAALLAFVLPVCVPGAPDTIPARLAGWTIAAAISIPLVVLVWPPPDHDLLRQRSAAACRALAELVASPGAAGAMQAAESAVGALEVQYRHSLGRPVPLSTGSRLIGRLVDQLGWLRRLAVSTPAGAGAAPVAAAVLSACAAVLRDAAVCLEPVSAEQGRSRSARLDESVAALDRARRYAFGELLPADDLPTEFGVLTPALAHELIYSTLLSGRTVVHSAAADRRNLLDRILGRGRPVAVDGPLAVAGEIVAGHLSRRSVWFQNSVRGAIGLALAVLIARVTDVEHGFWVALGTMSVLRTSALATGATAVRALIGTTLGFLVGSALVLVLGTSPGPLWALLPLLALVAGFLPEAVSFAAGQAAFTVLVVILFNIIQPVGWSVGLIRIEDVALGCLAGLVSGVLLWPYGAASMINRALADGYRTAAAALAVATRRVVAQIAGAPAGTDGQTATAFAAAAAAAWRLDDALREYLAERGSRPVPFAQLCTAVAGADRLRLLAEAVAAAGRGLPAPELPPPAGPASAGAALTAAGHALDADADRVYSWYLGVSTIFGTPGVQSIRPLDVVAEAQVVAVLSGREHDDDPADIRGLWRASWYLDSAARMSGRLLPTFVGLGRGRDQQPNQPDAVTLLPG